MNASLFSKLTILAESAKYDVSCSSSGVRRAHRPGGIGSAEACGVCHSFTEDGRCVSLLKVLMTNVCDYDCAYCVNRASNDLPRASLSPRELAELTIEFYRRNYIEGLFLSSAITRSPDHTMERLVAAIRLLRTDYRFNGYIHLKSIPGADRELIRRAGLYADRMSVNIEIPSERNLKALAPGKDHASVYKPMLFIRQGIEEYTEEKRRFRHTPRFVPAGQSTQMIVGASNEQDRDILRLASLLYRGPKLKRVYYSGYVPVNTADTRLPAANQVPLRRENRLYQADWLMRLYGFEVEEILDDASPDLELDMDPKLAWALRHPEYFPLDVNTAEYEQIVRVPGIGLKSAGRIISARRCRTLLPEHLRTLGVVMKRARYFLSLPALSGRAFTIHEAGPAYLRALFTEKAPPEAPRQLSLFDEIPASRSSERVLALT